MANAAKEAESRLLAADRSLGAQPAEVKLPRPVSKFWCLFPVAFSLFWSAIGLNEEWALDEFGDLLPVAHLRMIILFFCLTFLAHTIPLYFVSRTCESEEYQEMANAVCAADPRFHDAIVQTLNGIWWQSAKLGLAGIVGYGLIGYFAFRRVNAGLYLSTLGSLAMVSRFESGFIEVLVKMCNQDVNNFIALMIPDVPEGSPNARAEKSLQHFATCPDWQAVSSAHHEMDSRMEGLWAPEVGSSLLGPAVLLRIGQGLGIAIIGVVLRDVEAKIFAWSVGLFMISRGIFALQGAADLTTRCQTANPRFGLTAIKVVVNGFACHCRMSQKEETCFVKFNGYLQSTELGVELFGTMVTPGLVSNLIVAMLTNLPIMVGLLESVMGRVSTEVI